MAQSGGSLPPSPYVVGPGAFCLSVCRLFVCPQHNSKANDPRVFKLGIQGMTLGYQYPRSDMVLGLKGQRSRLELGLGLGLSYRNMAWVRSLRVTSSDYTIVTSQ